MIDSTKLTPLGRLLRSARLHKDLTLKEAAEAMGIRHDRLAEYERGAKVPNVNRAVIMAKVLGISPDEFFEKLGGKSERPV